jgi:hypothetical protein
MLEIRALLQSPHLFNSCFSEAEKRATRVQDAGCEEKSVTERALSSGHSAFEFRRAMTIV